jgi:replication-associated recombination protein RarA
VKLYLSSVTSEFLNDFSKSLPHAVLLTGPIGTGLGTLANQMAKDNGDLLVNVQPESRRTSSLAAISIERIRQLYVETRSRQNKPNFVIIDDADTMTTAAQNSLLKLLEEPNESIHFILTSHSPDRLLATIRSRVRTLAVPSLSTLESRRLLRAIGIKDELAEQRLLYVADGLPAELRRIAETDSDFKELSDRVQKARRLIEGTMYDRLAVANSLTEDRAGSLKLIETVILLLRRSLAHNPDQATLSFIDRLLAASDAIRANGHMRLHLSAAVIN